MNHLKGPTMQRILLIVILAAFFALTAVAVWHHGASGILELALGSFAGAQLLVDLVIALSLFLVWMWQDAHATGRNPWPWIVLTLVAGSFGPLLYLISRKATPVSP